MESKVAREHWTGAQYVTEHSTKSNSSHQETGAEIPIWRRMFTNTFSPAEAVIEAIAEKNTEVSERIKNDSNNICIREDLTKENMMFSQQSSQAIFEMGNVEHIELKKSSI